MSDQDTKDTQDTADQATEQAVPLFTIGDRQFNKEDAVTKITNADSFIDQLKAEGKQKDEELAQLWAQVDQSTKLDDALARMNNSQGTSEASSQETPTSAIDVEALKQELLASMSTSLADSEKGKQAEKNQLDSISAAQAVFGDGYESKLREKAKELGMSDNDIILEASANPTKFKALFGLNKNNSTTPTPSFGGRPPSNTSGTPTLKLGGFNAQQRVSNLKDTFASFAKAKGIDPELLNKF